MPSEGCAASSFTKVAVCETKTTVGNARTSRIRDAGVQNLNKEKLEIRVQTETPCELAIEGCALYLSPPWKL